ncbi:Tox-REase-5 domain-containing protein [Hyalangium rubrum]|uniref:Tox-REase-5 domain-containing protein n=1 Tax=Hyalangium rubrum TaxID=3103134 RepID=A0ABU5HH12_9BACT|nr:Tox-REase-5 domain-containing protein [Hyalangium sp. s54d21]MDY7232748.1 Tox-REase-5 domain-containing protein [Hyalangium sp. s54d21]
MGRIDGALVDVDYFAGLLVRSGVAPSALPQNRRQLTPDEAVRLLNLVLAAKVPLNDFGPWRMAAHLLLEVAQGEAPIRSQVLHERMRRFVPLLVLRPDGYLVRATTGRAVQHVGDVQFAREALRAEGFEVGPFYLPRGRFLYPVDSTLDIHPDAAVAGVYVPDEDTLGPMLEGANSAVADTIGGIVALVLHPLDSLEGLSRLPATVRALLENAPAHYAHFRAVTHGERVRLVSRIVTNLVLIGVTAGAGSTRLASVGSTLGSLRVPVLSLSAQGALTLERVALPASSTVTAISAAPGALYILHMTQHGAGGGGDGGAPRDSSWKPPPGGPGRWIPKNEGMSPRSRKYQSQITDAPEGWVYRVERGGEKFDFDGHKDGFLVDAKGPGYDNKFLDTLEPAYWFRETGAREMVENAQRQLRVANGVPIRWYVAEAKAARAIRRLLGDALHEAIEIIHAPPMR